MQYLILITIILGVLKLAGYLSITWLWVLSPIILGLAVLFALTLFFPFFAFGAMFFFGALSVVVERLCEKLEKKWGKDGEDIEGKTN